jgi:hypothetical protein
MKIAKSVDGRVVALLVGDELVVPGLPQHKMRYVGPIGPRGEDVVDPAKGQAAQFVHLDLIPNREQLVVGERGTANRYEQAAIQVRARQVVENGIVNRTLVRNCEHIGSHIRHGKPDSPQLKVAAGLALAAGILWWLGRRAL